MKILYIIALVLCVIFFFVVAYFAGEVESLRWQSWLDYNDYAYYEARDLSIVAGLCSLPFIAFFIFVFSFTLKYIKRMTAKVMSIIGLSISGLVFLFTLIPVSGEGTYDEFAPLLIIFIMIMLAFSIVNLVQAVRNVAPVVKNDSTIDDLI